MERVRLDFDSAEFEALSRLAEQHLRPVPNEARHIVRQALQQAGLLGRPSDLTAIRNSTLEPVE